MYQIEARLGTHTFEIYRTHTLTIIERTLRLQRVDMANMSNVKSKSSQFNIISVFHNCCTRSSAAPIFLFSFFIVSIIINF